MSRITDNSELRTFYKKIKTPESGSSAPSEDVASALIITSVIDGDGNIALSASAEEIFTAYSSGTPCVLRTSYEEDGQLTSDMYVPFVSVAKYYDDGISYEFITADHTFKADSDDEYPVSDNIK